MSDMTSLQVNVKVGNDKIVVGDYSTYDGIRVGLLARHTYCSNQARAGMNPKTLQYLMGHSDIGVTLNTYTHLKYDDAKDEVLKMTGSR